MKPCTVFFLLLLFTFPSALPFGKTDETGYRRITMRKRLDAFYREGGRSYLGKKVHLLVLASVFRRAPTNVTLPDGRVWFVFSNRTVPVLVSPKNLYFLRLRRKLEQAERTHRSIRTVSLFARVIRPSWDLKGRCHLLLYKVKCHGGKLKRIGD